MNEDFDNMARIECEIEKRMETAAYECRNADIPVALSCEDGLAPFRGTESLSVTEPGMLAQWASFPFSRRRAA